jgi:hypothetical protein
MSKYMGLSKLQKHILTKCYENRSGSEKKVEFYNYYPKKEQKENKIGIQVGIQKSIENLTAKDLVVAFGHKTAKKWSVERVRVTTRGKKLAKELVKSRQTKLPIK